MIMSTKSEIEEFVESMVWKDFVNELKILYALAQSEYDLVGEPKTDGTMPNMSETLIHLGDIKGRKKAVDYFLEVPNILLQQLEDEKDDNRRNQTD